MADSGRRGEKDVLAESSNEEDRTLKEDGSNDGIAAHTTTSHQYIPATYQAPSATHSATPASPGRPRTPDSPSGSHSALREQDQIDLTSDHSTTASDRRLERTTKSITRLATYNEQHGETISRQSNDDYERPESRVQRRRSTHNGEPRLGSRLPSAYGEEHDDGSWVQDWSDVQVDGFGLSDGGEQGNFFPSTRGDGSDMRQSKDQIQQAQGDCSQISEMVMDWDGTGEQNSQPSQVFENLHTDFQHLVTSIDSVSQILSSNTLDGETRITLTPPLPTYTPSTTTLHQSLSRLIDQFSTVLQSQRAQNRSLQHLLFSKDSELSAARETNLAQETHVKTSPEQPNSNPFQTLYQQELQRRKSAEKKFQEFKTTAEKMYQPDLESKNRYLATHLSHLQDEIIALKEQVIDFQDSAEHWQSEVDEQKTAYEKIVAGLEDEVARQRDEMLGYIKKYRDRAREEKYWHVRDLQDRISGLERELETTNALFGVAKREKAELEEEIGRLVGRERKWARETARLKRGWELGAHRVGLPLLDDPSSSEDEDERYDERLLMTPPKDKAQYIPRCHMPDAVAMRNTHMEEFCAKQKRVREDEERADRVMEKVRKWAMGRVYPPSGECWKYDKRMNSWNQWDGEVWLEIAAGV